MRYGILRSVHVLPVPARGIVAHGMYTYRDIVSPRIRCFGEHEGLYRAYVVAIAVARAKGCMGVKVYQHDWDT